jgi:hypothetical protein
MNPNLEQRLSDAVGSLTQWCEQAERRYSLGPLELLAVLSNVVAVRIGHEAAIERAAIEQLQGAMTADNSVSDTVREAFTRELTPDEDERARAVADELLNANPMCCQKHNMMGRKLGRCGGGPPGTRGGTRTGPEQSQEDTTLEGVENA